MKEHNITGTDETIRLAEIYPTFNGEVNHFGIGSPTIFLRLAGCHLRCYKKTKGILCDTPNFLSSKSGEDSTVKEIVEKLKTLRQETGISLICISGGDPLARSRDSIISLLKAILEEGFLVTIETSGTISVQFIDEDPFLLECRDKEKLSFILDYKTASAGIHIRPTVDKDLGNLRSCDFIKFVIDNEEDYQELKAFVNDNYTMTFAKISAGIFWGSSNFTSNGLFKRLKNDNLTCAVTMNFQVHKLVLLPYDGNDFNDVQI